jgi:hypothetical protein
VRDGRQGDKSTGEGRIARTDLQPCSGPLVCGLRRGPGLDRPEQARRGLARVPTKMVMMEVNEEVLDGLYRKTKQSDARSSMHTSELNQHSQTKRWRAI